MASRGPEIGDAPGHAQRRLAAMTWREVRDQLTRGRARVTARRQADEAASLAYVAAFLTECVKQLDAQRTPPCDNR